MGNKEGGRVLIRFLLRLFVAAVVLCIVLACPMDQSVPLVFCLGMLFLLAGTGIIFWALLLRVIGGTRIPLDLASVSRYSLAIAGAGVIMLALMLAVSFDWLYSWSSFAPHGEFQQFYLTQTGVLVRFGICSVLLGGISAFLYLFSRKYSTSEGAFETRPATRLRTICAVLLPVFFIVMTVLSVDLVLAQDAARHSSLWPVHFIVVAALGGMSVLAMTGVNGTRNGEITRQQLSDKGNCLLAFVLLHGYTGYSLVMIPWFAGIPAESILLSHQHQGTVMGVSLVLSVLLPFTLLLSSRLKKNIKVLKAVSGLIILGLAGEVYFWYLSGSHSGETGFSSRLVMAAGIPAAFAWMYFWQWRREFRRNRND